VYIPALAAAVGRLGWTFTHPRPMPRGCVDSCIGEDIVRLLLAAALVLFVLLSYVASFSQLSQRLQRIRAGGAQDSGDLALGLRYALSGVAFMLVMTALIAGLFLLYAFVTVNVLRRH
jgi:hypothetical protein